MQATGKIRGILTCPLSLAVAMVLGASIAPHAIAAPQFVTTCADSGAGSLRSIVTSLSAGDNIDLTRLRCSTITLTSGAIVLPAVDVAIKGAGVERIAIDANQSDRVFKGGTHNLQLDGLTLENGKATGNGGCIYSKGTVNVYNSVVEQCTANGTNSNVKGGGIYSSQSVVMNNSQIVGNLVRGPQYSIGGGIYAASLTAANSTIGVNRAYSTANNYQGEGGGIFVSGDLTLNASAVTNNRAQRYGGIAAFGGPSNSVSITNSTIAANYARYLVGGMSTASPTSLQNTTIARNVATTYASGGANFAVGLFVIGTTATLQSTLVSENVAEDGEHDISGFSITSPAKIIGSKNLIGISALALPGDTQRGDAKLGTVRYLYGRPPFVPLLAGSPAVDAGAATGLRYDQRGAGYARLVGGSADIGAYEVQGTGITHTVSNCNDAGPGSLRETLANSLSGDIIDLPTLNCTITLTSGELATGNGNISLFGTGLPLTIDGNAQSRIFNHTGFGTMRIANLTLSHGYYNATSVVAKGGCVNSVSSLYMSNVNVTGCVAHGGSLGASGGGAAANRMELGRSRIVGNSTYGSTDSTGGGGLNVVTDLKLYDTTIANNQISTAYGLGGGILSNGRWTISRSAIYGNHARGGGGAVLYGDGTLQDSTVSSNISSFGIGILCGGSTSVLNSTIVFNQGAAGSTFSAGIVVSNDRAPIVQSSIVFGNTNGSTNYDVGAAGTMMGANNLFGVVQHIIVPGDTIYLNPLLGPLQDNGGSTKTHALLAGSPAIDAGNNVAELLTDQRGLARVVGVAADIGAFEVQVADRIFANGFQ